jgi:hypothetical protein
MALECPRRIASLIIGRYMEDKRTMYADHLSGGLSEGISDGLPDDLLDDLPDDLLDDLLEGLPE